MRFDVADASFLPEGGHRKHGEVDIEEAVATPIGRRRLRLVEAKGAARGAQRSRADRDASPPTGERGSGSRVGGWWSKSKALCSEAMTGGSPKFPQLISAPSKVLIFRMPPHGVRGRDARFRAPPAQIRTSGIPAYGSYLGCLAAKRMLGQG